MKPFKILIFSFICCVLLPVRLSAQSQEISQLLLNIEKLAQFKEILAQMKTGYFSIENGYTRVQDIEHRTYILHKNYLDTLFQISDPVQNYQGVTDCLTKQKHLVQTYHHLQDSLSTSPLLSEGERKYVQNYAMKILQNSLLNMDDLIAVLSPNIYRMSDAERLSAINRSHKTIENQLFALSSIDQQLQQLLAYRTKNMHDKNQRNQMLSLR